MKTLLTIAAVTAIAGTASAQDLTATGSAEIRNGGVRLFNDDVSTAFWNVQEAGSFATVAAISFDASDILANLGSDNDVDSAVLNLFQSPAFFTSDNVDVDFFWASNDLPLTVGGLNNVNFANALTSFGAQPLVEDFGFVQGGANDNDMIELIGQGLAGEAGFIADLLAGGTITILATTDAGAASWSGAVPAGPTSDNDAPFLSVNTVPAPGAAALLGLAGVAGLRRRRA